MRDSRKSFVWWARQILPAGIGAVALGFSPQALANAELAEVHAHSCAGMIDMLAGYFTNLDSMLFEAEIPRCGGFEAFDVAFLAVVALVVISAIRFCYATNRRRLELATQGGAHELLGALGLPA